VKELTKQPRNDYPAETLAVPPCKLFITFPVKLPGIQPLYLLIYMGFIVVRGRMQLCHSDAMWVIWIVASG
jgi:hypothetical protein